MPRQRRTEHCWPVAHTLEDLLPLIPDPSSLEEGSSLRIERIMLPEVHLQLVQEIADRFCPDNGWQTVFVAANKFEADEIPQPLGKALVWHKPRRGKRAFGLALQQIRDEGLKPLVVSRFKPAAQPQVLWIGVPSAVNTLSPPSCPICSKELYWVTKCRGDHVPSLETRCWKHGCTMTQPLSKTPSKPRPRKDVNPKKAGTRKAWTSATESLVKQMRAEGATFDAIAAKVGHHPGMIARYLRKGGLEGIRQRRALANAFSDEF